jgi:DNA gyrase/topoisomerase IV subunit A
MGACLTSGSDEIVLVNHQGLSLRFYEDSTRSLRRASAGKRKIPLCYGPWRRLKLAFPRRPPPTLEI